MPILFADNSHPYFLLQRINRSIAKLPNTLPPITAPSDSPTFANILRASKAKRLFSRRLVVSSANEDIVVEEPQNPTATKTEYCPSKWKATDNTENTPKRKLPKTLILSTSYAIFQLEQALSASVGCGFGAC
jgi:hypothetical protein